MKSDAWRGCYDGGWSDLIVPEAFAHPAKYSRALIARIYEHARAKGWLAPGDVVLDPFGGVALGALDAMRLGLNWVGCELEQKFVDLGGQNIALWNRRYGHVPGWGTARLLQGDSRELASVVAGAGPAVSSPPFGDQVGCNSNVNCPSNQAILAKSPSKRKLITERYSDSPADPSNLGNLPATPHGLAMALASPPYEEPPGHGGSSPRFDILAGEKSLHRPEYGESQGQIGKAADFWSASRVILEQVYAVLKPSGHAIFVTKDFVRAKTRVPFSDQWQALCEAVGFRLVCAHRAMLVSGEGTQTDAFGQDKKLRRERKSFFRRLSERRGSPRIDWEDVRCYVKP